MINWEALQGGVTSFDILGTDGKPLKADAFGNNIAFNCINCGHAVLAIARKGWLGSSEEKATCCLGECGAEYYIKDIQPTHRCVVIAKKRKSTRFGA